MNKQVKIIEKSKLFLIISLVLVVASIVLLIFPKLNLGLDFTPGARITVNLNEIRGDRDSEYRDEIKSFIEEQGFTVEGAPQYVSREGGYLGIEYTLPYERSGVEYTDGSEFANEIEDLKASLEEHLQTKYGEAIINKASKEAPILSSMKDPSATIKLTRNALLAIVLAIVAMLIYIAIRFKLTAGVAAVLVLIHDVMIMLGLTAAIRIPVNTTFIAAAITIVGYSINASIILFDRIKENLAKYKDKGLTDADVANMSVAETFRRTLLTTATTLTMIVLVAILGTDSIREFALPIIFGLVSSVYSATILASVLWVLVRKISSKLLKGERKGYQKYAKEKANKQA